MNSEVLNQYALAALRLVEEALLRPRLNSTEQGQDLIERLLRSQQGERDRQRLIEDVANLFQQVRDQARQDTIQKLADHIVGIEKGETV